MVLKKLFFCIVFACSFIMTGQEKLSEQARISILTCGPGDQLYSAFGHTAIRVQDPLQQIDHVYNYGTFNFNQPGFYLKFVRGKLLYTLSRAPFANFLYQYEFEQRWVKEQLLDLSNVEKQEFNQFLLSNYRPGNRGYLYDYLFNNCSTKVPEIMTKVLGKELRYKEDHLEQKYTFRALIHQNLNTNSWSSFGIDLALGSVIDREAKIKEHMFLPLYVLGQLNNTYFKERPIVQRERTILDFADRMKPSYFLASPLFWISLLLLFVIVISYIDSKNDVRSRWLDFFLFFVTGAIGLLLFILWFLTDHSATADNFNILWAFPLNLIVAFFLLKNRPIPNWVAVYILGAIGLLLVTLLLWGFSVQQFSPLLLPIVLALAIRYTVVYKTIKNAPKQSLA